MGGLWQIGGLGKEIEASFYGYGGSVDAMRCLISSWLQVYRSDREGVGRGLRKNMGMADYRASRGLGMGDHCERERQSLRFFVGFIFLSVRFMTFFFFFWFYFLVLLLLFLILC